MIGHQAISSDLRIGATRPRRDQTAVKPIILLAAIAALEVTVTVYSMVPFGRSHSTSSILAPRPSRKLFRACSTRRRNRGSFSSRYFEPLVLGPEADQHSGWFSVAGDDDFFAFGIMQKPREIVLDLG
jgi:hypothetical protein